VPSDSAVIVGVGIMTAVGLTAAETTASVRAATMRFGQSSFHDKEFRPITLAEVPDDGLPELDDALRGQLALTAREERLLRLATRPLQESLSPLGAATCRPPMSLALPELETTRPLDRAAFVRHLAVQTGGLVDPAATDPSHGGRAGGIVAIGQAVATIVSGQAEFVLAGGVDTHRDPYILGSLDLDQRVKSNSCWDGFVPGEGAAFLLLASPQAAATKGVRPLASVSQVSVGFETGHLGSAEPYRGEGLAATMSQLVAQGRIPAPVREVYSSMNGESHWAKEWGVSRLRSRAAFDPNHGMHHPADSVGDVGAACGPLMVGLAALGIAGGYRGSPSLVYGSSDRGLRAAVVVTGAH
jgi:3-oxoacyl-[acyl-carrier-protein] synthase-1